MVYTGRSRDSLPFLDELSRFGDRITIRTDDVDGVPTATDLLGDRPAGTSVYACGPAPMLGVSAPHWPGAATSNCTTSGSPPRRWWTAPSSSPPRPPPA